MCMTDGHKEKLKIYLLLYFDIFCSHPIRLSSANDMICHLLQRLQLLTLSPNNDPINVTVSTSMNVYMGINFSSVFQSVSGLYCCNHIGILLHLDINIIVFVTEQPHGLEKKVLAG